MIERYVLRYFLAVVDQGNFTRAAAQCRISQPTLSVGIAKLEASLGQTLFLRTNRRIELTPSGTRFAVHARRIEAEFAAAERDLQDSVPTKLVRLGIATTLPPSWIAAALGRARRASTAERLEVVEGRSSELVALLDRGRMRAVAYCSRRVSRSRWRRTIASQVALRSRSPTSRRKR
jgi:DNA-binding transcriptional LysR family regulator